MSPKSKKPCLPVLAADEDLKVKAQPKQQPCNGQESFIFVDLPMETLYSIIHYLSPVDILSFISTNSKWNTVFGKSSHFWYHLHQTTQSIHNAGTSDINEVTRTTSSTETTIPPAQVAMATVNTKNTDDQNYDHKNSKDDWKKEKYRYILHSHIKTLSTVKWWAIKTTIKKEETTVVTSRGNRRRMNSEEDFDAFMMNLVTAGQAREAGVSESRIHSIIPNEREGHVSCMIGNYIVVTGGYVNEQTFISDDDDDDQTYNSNDYNDTNYIYIKHVDDLKDETSWKRIKVQHSNPMIATSSVVDRMDTKDLDDEDDVMKKKKFVYGATLTPLDSTRAVMFGGFQTVGYMDETTQVVVLHLIELEPEPEAKPTPPSLPKSKAKTRKKVHSNTSSKSPTRTVKAWWEVIECHGSNDMKLPCNDSNETFVSSVGRAYHAATLLYDRYLFIVGGMQFVTPSDDGTNRHDGSILKPIMLDCTSWTWYIDGITIPQNILATTSTPTPTTIDTQKETEGNGATSTNSNAAKPHLKEYIQLPQFPSGRHGCSLIADYENSNRNRLLLFGGGNGNDLLRSGVDNTEVWELSLNNCSSASDVLSSLPFQWRLIHKDQALHPILQLFNSISNDNANGFNHLNAFMNILPEGNNTSDVNCLNTVERLNLGRCHCAHRISRDIVLFAFGSGRPTTNGILCYNLLNDSFFRTSLDAMSYVPRARFTCASVFVESKGIIIYHGGYSTEGQLMGQSGPLSDTILLDLAPKYNRSPFNGRIWLPINHFPHRSNAITATDVQNHGVLRGMANFR